MPREYQRDNPSEKVTLQDVYDEFVEVAKAMKIKKFLSRKSTKKYCFELENIPPEAEYLEVIYSANHSPLSLSYLTGNTYQHVFGANASLLENFILDLNLMGPSWLILKNPEVNETPVTWCKMELCVQNQQHISIDSDGLQKPAPDFTIMSLNIKTYVQPETKNSEVIAISCLVNSSFNFDQTVGKNGKKYDNHFCIISKPSAKSGIELPIDFSPKMALKDYKKTRIDRMNNERELLNYFLAKFNQIDPDIIVGHDIYNYDYELLLARFLHYKIQFQWSKLGRLKRSGLPARAKDKHNLAGRLVCDIKILGKELIRSKSYDLTELAAVILKKGRFEIDQTLLPNYYKSTGQLLRLVDFLMKDNDLIISIMYELNCLPLVKQITNISGNLLSRTLLGGRSERNEYLLLHAFQAKGYMLPDKVFRKFQSGNKNQVEIKNEPVAEEEEVKKPKSSYTGGLVLEPKIGYYDRFILLMDFNSLYPSIIQEYNICFTTVKPKAIDAENESALANLNTSHCITSEAGILPAQIKKLVESRREVKKQLCDSSLSQEKRMQLDIKQKALKITANSMYGCLGFAYSRFYAKHLAALITFKGREILLNTKELVEKIGYEVIYGDTDSIMILTNCVNYEEVRETGHKIQTEVNRLYKLLEIDIDGVFRCMLLLKKKKYAALTVSRGQGANQQLQYQREIKGLDIVRRDWSVIAKIAGEQILDRILCPDQSSNVIADSIHTYLKELADSIRSGQIPVENFVINKALTKKPEEYGENGKSLTHVSVALRYNRDNLGLNSFKSSVRVLRSFFSGKNLRAGDTVSFVICLDGSTNSATQRGYHIDEVRNSSTLKVDTNYYLTQQLLPVVSRLCDPLDGTNTGIISEFLGVESNFKPITQQQIELDPALNCGEHKFDICKSLHFRCPYEECGKQIEIRDLFHLMNGRSQDLKKLNLKTLAEKSGSELFKLTLANCEHCGKPFTELMQLYFDLELRKQIQDHIDQFGRKMMVCDDHACSQRTMYLSGRFTGKSIACPRCKNGILQPEVRSFCPPLSLFSLITFR